MHADPIVVLIEFRIRPGTESLATQVMTSLIATVRREEPACSGITMIRDAADPSRILLYELWPDRYSYMGPHMETPHIKAFKAKGGELFTDAPHISFWDQVSRV